MEKAMIDVDYEDSIRNRLPRTVRISFGITSGAAIHKSIALLRLIQQHQWQARVILTENARRLISPDIFQIFSHEKPWIDPFDARAPQAMPHIFLSRDIDATVIMPATANFIAKLAHGIADDLLLTTCLARQAPLFIAPAMNTEMWSNATTQRNVAQLQKDGIVTLGPVSGDQACGDYGLGRLIEPNDAFRALQQALEHVQVAFSTMLITAGPTREFVDPIRYLSNDSSGKMGYAIAEVARKMGCSVTLISGPCSLTTHPHIKRIDVVSAQDMYQAVHQHMAEQDVFISVAAIGDYRVTHPTVQKINKKKNDPFSIQLTKNVDILSSVTALPTHPFCVGFTAVTENLESNIIQKYQQKKVDIMIGSIAKNIIGKDEAQLTLCDENGLQQWSYGKKIEHAKNIILYINKKYVEKNKRCAPVTHH